MHVFRKWTQTPEMFIKPVSLLPRKSRIKCMLPNKNVHCWLLIGWQHTQPEAIFENERMDF